MHCAPWFFPCARFAKIVCRRETYHCSLKSGSLGRRFQAVRGLGRGRRTEGRALKCIDRHETTVEIMVIPGAIYGTRQSRLFASQVLERCSPCFIFILQRCFRHLVSAALEICLCICTVCRPSLFDDKNLISRAHPQLIISLPGMTRCGVYYLRLGSGVLALYWF